MSKQNKGPEQNKQENERKERKAGEVAVLVITAGLLLFMLGYSVYHGFTASEATPTLSATPLFDEVKKRGDSYVLPVEIANDTTPTAEDVHVVVEITKEDGTVDEKEIDIAYLAERSRQKGYVVTNQRPTKNNVTVDIQSYKLP